MRLVTALILMAWGDGAAALVDRFAAARATWAGSATACTYQGFIKAWLRLGLGPVRAVAASLRRQMVQVAGEHARRFGFFVLAVDGSRFALPRTAGNQRVFGRHGKDNGPPQLGVTMLWQMGVGLPWAWRIGRGDAGERGQLRQMLDDTPAATLIVADAGFTGYDLLRTIIDSGRHVLVRASKALTLLRDLGHAEQVDEQTVYLWPSHAQRHRQPPLVLRLVTTRSTGDRRRKVYLLTSVRDPGVLSDEQVCTLYRMRWGVELCYRALKQTLDRRTLRAHAPATVLFEMHGLLLGLTLLGLMSVRAITAAGHDPLSWSLAATLRAARRAMHQPHQRFDWPTLLADARHDPYARRRKTRQHWPRKKGDSSPPGRPHIRQATLQEVHSSMQYQPV